MTTSEEESTVETTAMVDAFSIAPVRRTQEEQLSEGGAKRKATDAEEHALLALLKPTSSSILTMLYGPGRTEARVKERKERNETESRKKPRLSSDSKSSSLSSSFLLAPVHVRQKWWDKVDTWISSSSWKKVLVLIGPSGTGKTYCVYSYIAAKLGKHVYTMKPAAFFSTNMEQQLLTLLQDMPRSGSGISPWILHIPFCHPLEMMRATDWKYFEGLFIHSHLSLRTNLPLLVIEARASELQHWHYSPLRKIWKQSPNAVDMVYTQGWTKKDLEELVSSDLPQTTLGKCVERSHNDARQFLLHVYLDTFRPMAMAMVRTTTTMKTVKKWVAKKPGANVQSRLSFLSEKGMTPVLANLFTSPNVTMAELKSILRYFPLQDNLDYRFVDSCLTMVRSTFPSSSAGPFFPSMKILESLQETTRSAEENSGSEPMLLPKTSENKNGSPKWLKAKVIGTSKQPDMRAAIVLGEEQKTHSHYHRRRLAALSNFYRGTKSFQFGLVPERWAFDSTRSAMQLASLAMAHTIKWEWDNAGFRCKTDHLWSEIGKRLPHIRLFLYAGQGEE